MISWYWSKYIHLQVVNMTLSFGGGEGGLHRYFVNCYEHAKQWGTICVEVCQYSIPSDLIGKRTCEEEYAVIYAFALHLYVRLV